MRYTKHLTVKAWKKFDHIVDQEDGEPITAQEILLRKYKIILTDHRTRGEKTRDIINKIYNVDVNKGIGKFQKTMKSVDKAFTTWDKMKNKKENQRDYSALLGRRK